MKKVLIIDDDRAVCQSISLLLKRSGFAIMSVHTPKEALPTFEQFQPDLVVLDMNFTIDTSGKQGLQLLKAFKKVDKNLPVILITGWATLQLAVEGMKAGAMDFLAKPWDNKHLLNSIKTILTLRENKAPDKNAITDFEHIVGQNDSFLAIIEQAKRIAKTDASVLITGPSGAGKELIAEAIHYQSLRAENPFVKVNLGGLSASLFESELFGHKKGAFTGAHIDRVGRFEMADSGSIFLDEIGELTLDLQVKLLRVLQEKKYEILGSSHTRKTDVRIISATNKNLPELINNGTFREDLFYRINLITLRLPALAERKDDIPLLVNHFIEKSQKMYGIPIIKIRDSAINWLQQQHFSGNIRQLKNLIERTVLLAKDNNLLTKEDFQHNFTPPVLSTKIKLPDVGVVSLEEIEAIMIKKALDFHQNHISKTARSLGITRSALYRRMSKYGLKI